MTCFVELDGRQLSQGSPCGDATASSPFVSCCTVGDFCLENGICQYTESGHPGGSGYYVGGCTDPSLADASCNNYCKGIIFPAIVYNYGPGEWQCCGTYANGTRACGNPYGSVFSAPPPGLLKTTASVVTQGVYVTIPPLVYPTFEITYSSLASGQTIPSAPSPTLTSAISSTGGFSSAAAISDCITTKVIMTTSTSTSASTSASSNIGILAGLGFSIAWAALASAAVAWLLFRKRRSKVAANSPRSVPSPPPAPVYQQSYKYGEGSRMPELEDRRLAEMTA